ncbi:hypothetical protein HQ560_07790 [bacterium]|nr:hypothetical protein [bacterium]
MTPISPTHNPWVSRAMGLEVWDADLRSGADAVDSLAELGADMVSVKVSATDGPLLRACCERGFFPVETVVALEMPLRDDGRYARYARLPLRAAEAADVPALHAIAADTFVENRFMTDRAFPRDGVARYYANWIDDSLERDIIHVLETHGAVKGFYIVRPLDERRIDLLLAGVGSGERSSYCGAPLCAGTFAACARAGFRTGVAEIVATNLPILNLFAFFGARFTASYIRLHKWFDAEEGRP